MPYKCSCGYATEVGNAFSVHFRHHKGEQHQRLGWVDATTGEVSPTKPRDGRKPVGQPKQPQSKAMSEGGKLATVVAQKPAPVVFTIGAQQIELDPEALYESHLLYEDIKVHCGLTDSFSDVIRDGVGLAWQILVSNPRIEAGKVTVEVSHGRTGTENDSGEAGAK